MKLEYKHDSKSKFNHAPSCYVQFFVRSSNAEGPQPEYATVIPVGGIFDHDLDDEDHETGKPKPKLIDRVKVMDKWIPLLTVGKNDSDDERDITDNGARLRVACLYVPKECVKNQGVHKLIQKINHYQEDVVRERNAARRSKSADKQSPPLPMLSGRPGELEVQIREARYLPEKNYFGHMDPFATASLALVSGTKDTDPVEDGGANPKWPMDNEIWTFTVEDAELEQLTLEVKTKDGAFIGRAVIDVEKVALQHNPTVFSEVWYTLTDAKGREVETNGHRSMVKVRHKFVADENDRGWRPSLSGIGRPISFLATPPEFSDRSLRGEIHVLVKGAKGLRSMESMGKNDPYAEIKFFGAGTNSDGCLASHKTSAIPEAGSDVVWSAADKNHATFTYTNAIAKQALRYGSTPRLQLCVREHDKYDSHDNIGSVSIPVLPLLWRAGSVFERNLTLVSKDGTGNCGTLEVQMQFLREGSSATPLDEEAQRAPEPSRGELKVALLVGRELQGSQGTFYGRNVVKEPVARVVMTATGSAVTTTPSDGINPEWETAEYSPDVEDAELDIVVVEVFDAAGDSDRDEGDVLGRCEVPMLELLRLYDTDYGPRGTSGPAAGGATSDTTATTATISNVMAIEPMIEWWPIFFTERDAKKAGKAGEINSDARGAVKLSLAYTPQRAILAREAEMIVALEKSAEAKGLQPYTDYESSQGTLHVRVLKARGLSDGEEHKMYVKIELAPETLVERSAGASGGKMTTGKVAPSFDKAKPKGRKSTVEWMSDFQIPLTWNKLDTELPVIYFELMEEGRVYSASKGNAALDIAPFIYHPHTPTLCWLPLGGDSGETQVLVALQYNVDQGHGNPDLVKPFPDTWIRQTQAPFHRGTLEVHVQRAMALRGATDPYVKVRIFRDGRPIADAMTEVQNKQCSNPAFNERKEFEIDDSKLGKGESSSPMIEIQVLDNNSLIGASFAPVFPFTMDGKYLQEVLTGYPLRDHLSVQPRKTMLSGKLLVCTQFYKVGEKRQESAALDDTNNVCVHIVEVRNLAKNPKQKVEASIKLAIVNEDISVSTATVHGTGKRCRFDEYLKLACMKIPGRPVPELRFDVQDASSFRATATIPVIMEEDEKTGTVREVQLTDADGKPTAAVMKIRFTFGDFEGIDQYGGVGQDGGGVEEEEDFEGVGKLHVCPVLVTFSPGSAAFASLEDGDDMYLKFSARPHGQTKGRDTEEKDLEIADDGKKVIEYVKGAVAAGGAVNSGKDLDIDRDDYIILPIEKEDEAVVYCSVWKEGLLWDEEIARCTVDFKTLMRNLSKVTKVKLKASPGSDETAKPGRKVGELHVRMDYFANQEGTMRVIVRQATGVSPLSTGHRPSVSLALHPGVSKDDALGQAIVAKDTFLWDPPSQCSVQYNNFEEPSAIYGTISLSSGSLGPSYTAEIGPALIAQLIAGKGEKLNRELQLFASFGGIIPNAKLAVTMVYAPDEGEVKDGGEVKPAPEILPEAQQTVDTGAAVGQPADADIPLVNTDLEKELAAEREKARIKFEQKIKEERMRIAKEEEERATAKKERAEFLRELFYILDIDQKGTIGTAEINSLFESRDQHAITLRERFYEMASKEGGNDRVRSMTGHEIAKAMDLSGDGDIHWEEYVLFVCKEAMPRPTDIINRVKRHSKKQKEASQKAMLAREEALEAEGARKVAEREGKLKNTEEMLRLRAEEERKLKEALQAESKARKEAQKAWKKEQQRVKEELLEEAKRREQNVAREKELELQRQRDEHESFVEEQELEKAVAIKNARKDAAEQAHKRAMEMARADFEQRLKKERVAIEAEKAKVAASIKEKELKLQQEMKEREREFEVRIGERMEQKLVSLQKQLELKAAETEAAQQALAKEQQRLLKERDTLRKQQNAEREAADKRASEEAKLEMKRAAERKRAIQSRPSDGRIHKWNAFHVARWIEHDLELPQYADIFFDGAVDGQLLLSLEEKDLVADLGVNHRLHRKKILRNIARLRMARDAIAHTDGQKKKAKARKVAKKRKARAKGGTSFDSFGGGGGAGQGSGQTGIGELLRLRLQKKVVTQQKEIKQELDMDARERKIWKFCYDGEQNLKMPKASIWATYDDFMTKFEDVDDDDDIANRTIAHGAGAGEEFYQDAMDSVYSNLLMRERKTDGLETEIGTNGQTHAPWWMQDNEYGDELETKYRIEAEIRGDNDKVEAPFLRASLPHQKRVRTLPLHATSEEVVECVGMAVRELGRRLGAKRNAQRTTKKKSLWSSMNQENLNDVYQMFVRLSRNDAPWLDSTNRLTRLKFLGGLKVLLALDLSWEQYDAVFRFINTSRSGVITAKEFVTAFDKPGEFNELRLGAGQRDVLGEESRNGGKKRRPRTGSALARSQGELTHLMLTNLVLSHRSITRILITFRTLEHLLVPIFVPCQTSL